MRSSPLKIGTLFGCLLATFEVTTCATGFSADPPNVVVILADDLGYGDLGCYGGKIATPAIDRLAAEGVRFTDAHSGSSVCTPTRYGLLTGRYGWRSRLQSGVLGGLSPRLIEADRITLAGWLQTRGYHTACIGKWHLGMNWRLHDGKQVSELGIETREQVFSVDYAAPISDGPTAVGFDYFFGISASLDMVPYAFIENARVTELPHEDRDFPMMIGRSLGRTRRGPAAPGFEASDVLPKLVSKSVEYIERRAAAGKGGAASRPFFLYVPLTSPHTPILPTEAHQGKSQINPYADFVMQSDQAVGEILAALDRTGVSQRTLVIFTSDNGCSPQADLQTLAEHGHFPSGPFRGHKADLFEGGHRVPFIVRFPGRTVAASVSAQLVCLTDIFATVAQAVGAEPLAEDLAEDSFSFWGVLSGDTSALDGRESLVSHSINGSFAIRRGEWKLLLCPGSGGWSPPRPGSPGSEILPKRQLFNLVEDVAESTNRAQQHPDFVAELEGLLRRLVDGGRSTPGKPQANSVVVELDKGGA